ncbi:hypothetical protein U3516DRAFT_745044 [Neocallimastix sp. 'constans']
MVLNLLTDVLKKKKSGNIYYHGIGFYSIFLFDFCFKNKSDSFSAIKKIISFKMLSSVKSTKSIDEPNVIRIF